ncbi:hypothetical protein ONZ45_g18873 [Pleurotus djamor]|nr:hypothetical protein ONZ45_g18873 [Pleurotus djamor]
MLAFNQLPKYESLQADFVEDNGKRVQLWRTTVTIPLEVPLKGVGDNVEKKESEMLAALSAVYQLHRAGLLENPRSLRPVAAPLTSATLSDESTVTYEQARSFMDYYCRRFQFPKPDISYKELSKDGWEAVMTVDDRRIGLGKGPNKKVAQTSCYLDVTQYLEKCDPDLWKAFVEAAKTGSDLGLAPKVFYQASGNVDERIQALCQDIRRGDLYRNRPTGGPLASERGSTSSTPRRRAVASQAYLEKKSQQLLTRHNSYREDPKMETMRNTIASLPVHTHAENLLSHIQGHNVTICMAATGSGKTTQIPQLILDSYIKRGEGASCNIICTQPRRLAALSVADRVAKERGEVVGQSVGFHVRFENRLPEPNGSITFCTTGIFLKRMHSALSANSEGAIELDDVTHIVVDEVHERDVDTDLVLVVLKRLLADRAARNKPLKVILMSATVNPTLFQNYFPDSQGLPAKVIDVPGRSYPVTKYFLDDFVPQLIESCRRIRHSLAPELFANGN